MTPELLIVLVATLLCGYIDARTGFIPDRITYPALGGALLIAAALHRFDLAAQGTLLAGGTFAALRAASGGRGMGLGDVKLAACIGAGFGPLSGMIALGSSFVAGGFFGAYLLLTGQAERKTPIRFGPFLALGSVVALLARILVPQWL